MGYITFFDEKGFPIAHVENCLVTVVQPNAWQDILEPQQKEEENVTPPSAD